MRLCDNCPHKNLNWEPPRGTLGNPNVIKGILPPDPLDFSGEKAKLRKENETLKARIKELEDSKQGGGYGRNTWSY